MSKSTKFIFMHTKCQGVAALWFLVCFLMLAIPDAGVSQQAPDLRHIDSITLQLYNLGKWTELADEGSNAIKNGLDYYYLRMRVGIAFYETKNYRKAIPHFQKALALNPMSKITSEYLYFSYLSGGRPYDARITEPLLGEESRKKNKISKPSFIEEVYVEGGPAFAGNQNLNNRGKQHGKQNQDSIYSASYYYNNIYYGFAGIKLRLLPALSIYQGYGYLTAPVSETITYLNTPVEEFNYTTVQHEYYANMEINLPGRIFLVPAFHKLWIDFATRMDRYDPAINSLVFDTVYAKEEMYAASLSLKKDFSIFAVEVSGTYGDFGHAVQKQLGISALTFPFGNLDFYTNTGITRMWNDDDDEWIFYQMAGTSLGKNVWFEAEITYGQLRDYTEKNAFVMYNSPEDINYKVEGTLIFDISPKVEFMFKYRYLQRVNTYLTYTNIEEFTFEYSKYPYHTLIGGLKWKL